MSNINVLRNLNRTDFLGVGVGQLHYTMVFIVERIFSEQCNNLKGLSLHFRPSLHFVPSLDFKPDLQSAVCSLHFTLTSLIIVNLTETGILRGQISSLLCSC